MDHNKKYETINRKWLIERVNTMVKSYGLECFYKWESKTDQIKFILYNPDTLTHMYFVVFIREVSSFIETLETIHLKIIEWKDSEPKYKPYGDLLKKHYPIKPSNISLSIKKVIFSDPCTIILWSDGTKTIVRTQSDDIYDPEKGMAMAICKKYIGGNGNYYDEFKKWLPKEKVDDFKDYSLEALQFTSKKLHENFKEAVDDLTRVLLERKKIK